MKAETPNADSPCVSSSAEPARCRWLSEHDKSQAPNAEVIRLIVDDSRWGFQRPNDIFQRNFLGDVFSFIGQTRAVLVTPAGTVTTAMGAPHYTLASGLDDARRSLASMASIPVDAEVLLGADVCVTDESTPLQSVILLTGGSPKEATVKFYPADHEKTTLLSWLACQSEGDIPADLAPARRVLTRVGVFLVLVCNDAVLFSGRSRSLLSDELKVRIRAHFTTPSDSEARLRFALMAMHWQDSKTGNIFRNAAYRISEDLGCTTVPTTFAPRDDLAAVAHRFPVQGQDAAKVATLLVE
jgi:hypothetical protein